ncbi:unnamed protein product [Auanema sp. JU1783]|nr:unnamed protein product [Auanema sp. JU1783]
MWINEFVLTNYRPPKMTNHMCFKSIFHWTNETINIWSHLLGFFYFTFCQLDANIFHIPTIGGSKEDHLVFTLSIFGSQICMLLSACYHTFGCTSSRKREQWLKMDVFGISAGLLGMYLGGIYTAFYCFPDHLESYLYFLLTIFLITAYVPSRKDFFEKKVVGNRIGFLHIIYTTIIVFGICPTIHWVYLHGGLDNLHVQRWLPSIIILYSLTAAAFFFYVSLVPERISPGTFDVVGCSHQWWHLLILAAMVWWQRAGRELLSFYRSHHNSCHISTVGVNLTSAM